MSIYKDEKQLIISDLYNQKAIISIEDFSILNSAFLCRNQWNIRIYIASTKRFAVPYSSQGLNKAISADFLEDSN